MAITTEENKTLQLAKEVFKVQELTKEQAEFILGRELTNRTWQQYTTSQKRKYKNIGPEDNVYSVKHLFQESKEKLKPQFTYAEVAKHAAKEAQRRHSRKKDYDFRVAKLFRDNKSSYRIEKVREYKYNKCNTKRSEYKIYGEVDIFQMHTVLQKLINNYRIAGKR